MSGFEGKLLVDRQFTVTFQWNVSFCRDSINTPDSINSDRNPSRADDEEADTDLETDRLLGQQRLDNIGNLEKVRRDACLSRIVDYMYDVFHSVSTKKQPQYLDQLPNFRRQHCDKVLELH